MKRTTNTVCEKCGVDLKNESRYQGYDAYETESGEFVEEWQHLCHMCGHINYSYVS